MRGGFHRGSFGVAMRSGQCGKANSIAAKNAERLENEDETVFVFCVSLRFLRRYRAAGVRGGCKPPARALLREGPGDGVGEEATEFGVLKIVGVAE